MAKSIRLKNSALKDEVYSHCRILRCDPVDSVGHLLSALGLIGIHLENFPLNHYAQLVKNCFYWLDDVNLTPKIQNIFLLKKYTT